jgi:hypothetical protein
MTRHGAGCLASIARADLRAGEAPLPIDPAPR